MGIWKKKLEVGTTVWGINEEYGSGKGKVIEIRGMLVHVQWQRPAHKSWVAPANLEITDLED